MKALRFIPIAPMLAILCLPSIQAEPQKHTNTASVTGCLMKGDQANEYKITEKGITYDLYPTANLNMANHVGHKVRVTGKFTSAQPARRNTASRMAEERVDVNSLKHISNTCP